MRLKSLALATTSMFILAGAAPAIAQTEAAPAGQTADQNTPPADDENAIVVSGIRQSLQSSQNLKRNSAQIVDAIVAEDIGKLPDIAVSDTAARIVGVQVDRGGGEAGRVLVRGLPDFNTSYNGREIFTAETRQVALQDFPAGSIGAVEVYKASTADLIEPGLAGLINVRSRRPFDFDGLEVAGSAWGLYTYAADKVTPNGNLLISDRWDTGIGEIGVLVGGSYTQLKYKDSTRSNTDFIATPATPAGQTVRMPDIQRVTYGVGDRSRPSGNASIQWRPAPGLEFYAEGLYQGFRNKVSDRELDANLYGGTLSNLTFRDGTNLVESGTVTGARRAEGFQGATYNKTDTYQFAVGGSYEHEGLRITADLARTDSTFTGSTASVDYHLTSPSTIDFNLDSDGKEGGTAFAITNVDLTNPANYRFRGFYEEAQQARGKDWQARVDLSYDTGVDVLKKVEAGFRFTDRDAHREFGNRYWNFLVNDFSPVGISQVPLDYALFAPGFRGADAAVPTTWFAPTYQSVRDNLVELRQFSIANSAGQPGNASTGTVAYDPLQSYDANEKTFAGYGQIRYEIGSADGLRVDGVIGLRVVQADLDIAGTSTVNGAMTPVNITRTYYDWLPNASARVRFTDQFALRLSATKTRTKPTFAQLNPSASFGPPATCPTGTAPTSDACRTVGNGGNPYLNPFESNNYDASLEYYFAPTSFASAAVFRRDLSGFIQPSQVRYTDPVLGPVLVNGSVNTGQGRIDGAEAQFQTFFDVLGLPHWARSFGVQANVTYLDAKTDQATNTPNVYARERILGVSKWAYNLAGIYENAGLSLRLSYNYRSDYLATLQPRGDDLYREYVDPISRFDFSGSYDVLKNLTFFADWTNILNKPFKSHLVSARAGAPEASYPRVVRYEEMTVSTGVRFRF
jgi:iron complex outermembrane receptor protein